MERSNCRGCEKNNLIKFLELGEMPLAGGFLPDAESIQHEILYNLDIFVCADCGLLQILELVEPDILFQDYFFSSSTIDPLVTHFDEYAQWIKNKIQRQFVVEFGCNDGVLLKPLNKLGIKTFGIMEHDSNNRASWRIKFGNYLKNDLGHEVINPFYQSRKRVQEKKATNYHAWTIYDPQR